MLVCPFCGAAETDRIDLEGRRFLVFACMFTPEVDPALDEGTLTSYLASAFQEGGAGYFRRTCDRLHLFVVRGAGGEPPAPSTAEKGA
jgi:hypothetical protein